MYSNNPYYSNMNYAYFSHYPYCNYNRYYLTNPYFNHLYRQPIQGQATWTEGGQVTKCGIPWSENQYMTAAVGENSPYQCGQTIKVRNRNTGRELLVTVVDEVPGYPQNKINLHKRVFEALGANPQQGVIDVEILPSPELEQQQWGKYLLELTQLAYPNYNVTEYNFIQKTQVSPSQTKESYEFILQSPQERITVMGNVIYNPSTDRVISFDISEV
ncbi:DUF3889 domain-containing protein [Virgibacillus doumboii]|uniref:DUF3889 domain-containing protein n=1 Tax=Virgibacillus doumboii TaxID=2697503 RepID=UPI001FE78E1A|nr:DUF3889 domain-containing protein [Virgibacillus doumboii]